MRDEEGMIKTTEIKIEVKENGWKGRRQRTLVIRT